VRKIEGNVKVSEKERSWGRDVAHPNLFLRGTPYSSAYWSPTDSPAYVHPMGPTNMIDTWAFHICDVIKTVDGCMILPSLCARMSFSGQLFMRSLPSLCVR